MTRYLAGLITATAALGAGVWLLLAPYALNYPSGSGASKADLWAGAGVCGLSLVTILVWAREWRARLRADGLLPERPTARPEAPDEPLPAEPAPTIEDLHGLLKPLVAALAADQLEHAGRRSGGTTGGHPKEEQ